MLRKVEKNYDLISINIKTVTGAIIKNNTQIILDESFGEYDNTIDIAEHNILIARLEKLNKKYIKRRPHWLCINRRYWKSK